MVYAPFGEGVGVSRRLDDKERDRLRKEAAKLDLRGGGAIIRTSAQGAKRADLERELLYLFKLNEVLQKRVEETPAPALVFQEADLSVRVVRDVFSAEFERAVVDDEKQHHRLVSFFSRTAPDLVERVELWEEEQPLFEAFGIDEALSSTLSRRIDLPSGGYLVIDYAEALTVIDVNTGSFVGRGKSARLEDTITKTNLEAADEVVRQLRLRDIGGIIVIDFIDMARARNRDAVLKALRGALDEDRTKTFVVEISPSGLVEMTRQNVTDGVREIMTRPCPTCGGEGVIKSEETLAIEFERRMRDIAKSTKAEALLIQMNPRVSSEFTRDDARALHAIEHETGKLFVFEGSEGLPLDHFAVVLEGTRERGSRARGAVPRRRGGPRPDRRAAHVQPGRCGRQGRRLHDLGGRWWPVRRRKAPGPDRRGGPHRRGRVADGRGSGAGRRGGDSQADERFAIAQLALASVGRLRRVACLRRLEGRERVGLVGRVGLLECRWQAGRRRTEGGRGWPTIEASAPWPQRRTAPFRCQGRIGCLRHPSELMYAIVKTGGKQYRVEEGQSLLVERLPDDDGAKVGLEPLLYVDGSEVDRRRRTLAGEGRGASRRPRARPEAPHRQVQAQARLQAPHRAPPGADPARSDLGQARRRTFALEGEVRSRREARGRAGLRRNRGGRQAGTQHSHPQAKGGRRWRIRRASAPRATAATRTQSASA